MVFYSKSVLIGILALVCLTYARSLDSEFVDDNEILVLEKREEGDEEDSLDLMDTGSEIEDVVDEGGSEIMIEEKGADSDREQIQPRDGFFFVPDYGRIHWPKSKKRPRKQPSKSVRINSERL
ncbi:hypothetical protein ACHWQZ_G008356 [Mnemiopsis leidyi]